MSKKKKVGNSVTIVMGYGALFPYFIKILMLSLV